MDDTLHGELSHILLDAYSCSIAIYQSMTINENAVVSVSHPIKEH